MFAIVGQMVLAWYIADVLSAIFHWVTDSLGGTWAEQVPVYGAVVRDFRGHHERPLDPELLGYGWGPTTIVLGMAGVAIGLVGLWTPWPYFFAVLAVATATAQAAHRWAHAPVVPTGVRMLQKLGLLQSPARHQGHHRSFDRDFGSINGWSHGLFNLLLDVTRSCQ